MLIGRKNEQQTLLDALKSDESEFIAVYGRRRVGKTYLIRETFNYHFAFEHSGLLDAPLAEQLEEFMESLYSAGMPESECPKSWREAFRLLQRLLEKNQSGEKKVIFLDELPWMDTPRSNFIRALDHFWNSWATRRKDIVLIVCGSATSWIISNIVASYGGLHNRVTRQIWLRQFTLHECELYCRSRNLELSRKSILEGYMAMGGVPYYWRFLKTGMSLSQNFDRMFFSEGGEMTHEYEALYASLFRFPEKHIAIVRALAGKKGGMQRDELLNAAGLSDNSGFSTALSELEQCGFIRHYTMLGNRKKGAVWQLMDSYTLFYFRFIAEDSIHSWSAEAGTSVRNVWSGLAFERVCLQHLPQICRALGFSGVVNTAHSWTYRPKDGDEKGVQIDLLIDRNDDVINLCEMKYSGAKYSISAAEDERLRERKSTFVRLSGTGKTVHITMITPYGLAPGSYNDDVQSQVTMDDLFSY